MRWDFFERWYGRRPIEMIEMIKYKEAAQLVQLWDVSPNI
jgi:hypothetical protein